MPSDPCQWKDPCQWHGQPCFSATCNLQKLVSICRMTPMPAMTKCHKESSLGERMSVHTQKVLKENSAVKLKEWKHTGSYVRELVLTPLTSANVTFTSSALTSYVILLRKPSDPPGKNNFTKWLSMWHLCSLRVWALSWLQVNQCEENVDSGSLTFFNRFSKYLLTIHAN